MRLRNTTKVRRGLHYVINATEAWLIDHDAGGEDAVELHRNDREDIEAALKWLREQAGEEE